MDFLLVKLIFTLRLESDLPEPEVLLRLKQPFTDAFRIVACRNEGACERCLSRDDCPFQSVFSQKLAADPIALKRHQKPPLPFAFQTPLLSGRLSRGDRFELGLVMAGRAAAHAGIFCEAVARVFRQGVDGSLPPTTIVDVESVGVSGFRNSINFGESAAYAPPVGLVTVSLDDLMAMNILPHDRIRIRILTPMCNVREGTPIRFFSFSSFMMPLMRRISSIAFHYCGSCLDMNFKHLSSLCHTIEVSENDFCWVDRRKGRQGGILGSGLLNGSLADFHSLLMLGEYLNCGKGAAFGSGRYEIIR